MNTTLNVNLALRRMVSLVALAFFAFTSNGCDFIASKLGVDEVDVPTSSFASSVNLVPDQTTLVEGKVNLSSVKLPDIFDVDEVILSPDYFTFTPSAASALGKTSASGQIILLLLVNNLPVAYATITIKDDKVTDITPKELKLTAKVLKAQVDAMIAKTPEPNRTKLGNAIKASGWETLTLAQVVAAINQAFKSTEPTVSVALLPNSTITGKLNVSKLRFGLKF